MSLDYQKEFEAVRDWNRWGGNGAAKYGMELVYFGDEEHPKGWVFYVDAYPFPLGVDATIPADSYPGSHQAVPFESAAVAVETFEKFMSSELGQSILGECECEECECPTDGQVEADLEIKS